MMYVCMTCHAYGSSPSGLAKWSDTSKEYPEGHPDYCDWHDRVVTMTEEEYALWAQDQMDDDDGGQ